MSGPEILFPGSKWLYLGGEEGFNLIHVVCDVDTETDLKMPHVTSWSLWDDTSEEGGWTWCGPLNLFLRAFKPLGGPEEAGA